VFSIRLSVRLDYAIQSVGATCVVLDTIESLIRVMRDPDRRHPCKHARLPQAEDEADDQHEIPGEEEFDLLSPR